MSLIFTIGIAIYIIINVAVAMFAITQFVLSLETKKADYAAPWLYLFSLFFGLAFRVVYILAGYMYKKPEGLILKTFGTLSAMFIFMAAIMFLIYLFQSLQDDFNSKMKRLYGIFKNVTWIFLALMWIFAIFCVVWLDSDLFSHEFISIEKSYFYVSGISYIFVMLSAIVILVLYFGELKKYPLMLSDKKPIMIMSIVTLFFQVFMRVMNCVLEFKSIWKLLWDKGDEYIIIISILYFIMTDIFSIIVYTFFLRKDTIYLKIIDEEEQLSSESDCTASFIEEYFRRKSTTLEGDPSLINKI